MPALIDTRLAYLRYTTKQYILDEPVPVIIRRQVKMAVPGGGHDYPTIALPVQIFRVINQTNNDGIEFSGNDEGEARKFIYIFVGEWDADIQPNDSWSEGLTQYSVDGIIPANDYEVRAVVTAFTKAPDHG